MGIRSLGLATAITLGTGIGCLGGGGGAGDTSGGGCSDGSQEGFKQYPGIAGCAATWAVTAMRDPPTGVACGNDKGACNVPADACAAGWHVCGTPPYGPIDISARLTVDQCRAETAGDFAAALGDQACDPCSTANPGYGTVCCGSECLVQGGSCVWQGQTPWFGVINGQTDTCGDIGNSSATFGVLCCEDGDAATSGGDDAQADQVVADDGSMEAAPEAPTVLYSAMSPVVGVEVYGSTLYWLTTGTQQAMWHDGAFFKGTIDGGSYTSGAAIWMPDSIAIDAQYVYFSTNDGNQACAVSLTGTGGGCEACYNCGGVTGNSNGVAFFRNLTPNPGVTYAGLYEWHVSAGTVGYLGGYAAWGSGGSNVMAADATDYYYSGQVTTQGDGGFSLDGGFGGGTTTSGVMVLSLAADAGPPTFAWTDDNPVLAVALDSANVYWVAGNALKKAARSGGSPEVIDTGLTPYSVNVSYAQVVVDGSNVYWEIEGATESQIRRVSTTGQDATTIVAQPGMGGFCVGSSNLFWGGTNASAPVVYKGPK